MYPKMDQGVLDLFADPIPPRTPKKESSVDKLLPQVKEDVTLLDAQTQLRGGLAEGTDCPCCGRFTKIYERKINATMGKCLCWLVVTQQSSGVGWVDVPNVGPRWLVRSNQLPTLKWWGLVERRPTTERTQKHSGLWRPTQKGVDFAFGRISVPSTVITFFGTPIGFDGGEIYIQATAGKNFNYEEAMKPVLGVGI